jgi:hypothetical protein
MGSWCKPRPLVARLGDFRGQTLKLLVWILVIVWCLQPPVWLLVTAATNKTTSPPATSLAPTLGQNIGLGGGMALFMLWMYGI